MRFPEKRVGGIEAAIQVVMAAMHNLMNRELAKQYPTRVGFFRRFEWCEFIPAILQCARCARHESRSEPGPSLALRTDQTCKKTGRLVMAVTGNVHSFSQGTADLRSEMGTGHFSDQRGELLGCEGCRFTKEPPHSDLTFSRSRLRRHTIQLVYSTWLLAMWRLYPKAWPRWARS